MPASTAVGDSDDTAFAVMAGTAVLIAVVVALMVPRLVSTPNLAPSVQTDESSQIADSSQETEPTGDQDPPTEPVEETGTTAEPSPLPATPTAEAVEARLESAGFPTLVVTVTDAGIIVSGSVSDESLRRAALGVVQEMDGVDDVIDQIRVP